MNAAKYVVILWMLTGCVSVSLGGGRAQRASGVRYSEPGRPYQKANAESSVDAIWRNPSNGNALSYLSDCNDESDPPLQTIEQGVLQGLTPYQYQTQEDATFDNRAARRILVKGRVDGVPSLVDMLIFKKNACIYILTFAGIEKHFRADGPILDRFISGFRAP